MSLLVPLADASLPDAGAKAATLGRLRRAGLPVPDGAVVPADVDLTAPGVAAELSAALERLGGPVAVRSSAADEDGAHASGAGQYESVLGVTGADEVVAAIRTCRASAGTARVAAYRAATRARAGSPAVAVLVQRMVDARVAGVLFTSSEGATVIEAAHGLGTAVVQGAVDPDRVTVRAGGVVTHRVGGGGPCLGESDALALAALGDRVTALLCGPQDVEWALDADGAPWLLQARPVTAPLPSPTPACGGHTSRWPVQGTPGSGGRARGPVRVARSPDDFGRVRAGDVLVCRATDPAWTPLFGVVAAVVTETGGLLSHAAIVARELRLPAVLGVPDALAMLGALPDGAPVTVDGDAGTVTPAA